MDVEVSHNAVDHNCIYNAVNIGIFMNEPSFILTLSLFVFTLFFPPSLPLCVSSSPLPLTHTHTHTHTTSIIGTPTTAQWPVESSITVDQFVQFKAKPWLQLLPEASDDAQDLLSVCHSTLEIVRLHNC